MVVQKNCAEGGIVTSSDRVYAAAVQMRRVSVCAVKVVACSCRVNVGKLFLGRVYCLYVLLVRWIGPRDFAVAFLKTCFSCGPARPECLTQKGRGHAYRKYSG